MKAEFLDFIQTLMDANPDIVAEKMTDEVKEYLDILKDSKDFTSSVTDNGKQILVYMQQTNNMKLFKAKDIAEGLGTISRGVAASLRKLVQDGYVEKMGQNPIVYSLTTKGKNFKIDIEE